MSTFAHISSVIPDYGTCKGESGLPHETVFLHLGYPAYTQSQ